MDWHLLGNGVAALECALVLAWLCRIGVRGLRKLPVPVLIVFLSLATGTGIVAQKTNGVNNLPPMPLRSAPVVETVSEDDVARGWRVECVTTNETISYTMPSNAVYVSNWHVHGARSSFGNNVVNLGSAGTPRPTGWTFPLGTNSAAFSSFWYFVDGRIRPKPKDAAREICAVGVPMSAGCSVLDVGDKNNNYTNPAKHAANPGLKWLAASGADTLLGYAYKAPKDDQGGTAIVDGWCAQRSSLGDVAAWMRANDNAAGHNACALRRIDQNSFEYQFFNRSEHGMFGCHVFNSYKLTSEIMEVEK